MLSERARRIEPSATFAMKAKADALKKQGTTVFDFGIGEPDFAISEEAKQAVAQALKENFTHYTAAAGIAELRKAIAEKFKREDGIDYEPEQIVVSCGAKHSLYNIFQVLLDKGDEVIVPSPYWVSYSEQIKLAEGKPVFAETGRDFALDAGAIAEKVSGRTKAILVNSPCNPTGNVVEKKDLQKIAGLAVEKNVFVISDEVYQPFVYDGAKHYSIASFGDEIKARAITVNAVSKTYAMTGLRIGYTGGPKEIIKAIGSLQEHSTSNPSNLSQRAALAALQGSQKPVEEMKKAFAKRRKIVLKAIEGIAGIDCPVPKGAFYVFPYVDSFFNSSIKNSSDFCNRLLEQAHISLVPGGAFGRDSCVRLSYAVEDRLLTQGLCELKKALENWGQQHAN